MDPVESGAHPAGLLRRLLAIVYDAMLLIALWMVATALWLPLAGGEAISPTHTWYRFYQLSLLLTAFLYFVVCWMCGGQTVGMRAWRLRVRTRGGGRLRVLEATKRFVAAAVSWLALGAGFAWSLLDERRRTWHDIYSDSVLLHEPKRR